MSMIKPPRTSVIEQRQDAQRRLGALREEHQTWRPMLVELSKYICPTRGFFYDMPNYGREPNYKDLIDATSTRALRVMAAGMTSGLTSPSRPWFKLAPHDPDLAEYGPVKEWCETVQLAMMGVFSRSNIYQVLHSGYEELGCFGTAAQILLEDYDQVVRGRNFTAGEYYLACGHDGRVNTFGREYWMTVSQMVKEFGYESCSSIVQNLFDTQVFDKWIKLAYLIEPNDQRDPSMFDSRNMAFRARTWEQGSQEHGFLRDKGYRTFPVLAPRWHTTTTADTYGKGPGWDTLGDIRMLQLMQRDKLLAIAKLADPPISADSSIDKVNTLPGGVTRSSATTPNAGVRSAYDVRPDIQALQASIQATQNDIRQGFYADLFMMLANDTRSGITAREVAERHEEKLLMLGPVVERLESELTDPLIDRTFEIMMTASLGAHRMGQPGLIPPPPPELQGQMMKVDYISILAQAQKMVGVTALQQASAYIENLATIDPDVKDVYDFDEMATAYGDSVGLPPKIVRSQDKIQAIRAKKAQAAAQAQQQQNAMAMVQGAKTLADTRLGQNSALDALVGAGGAAPGGAQ